jgi:hypothetical protein
MRLWTCDKFYHEKLFVDKFVFLNLFFLSIMTIYKFNKRIVFFVVARAVNSFFSKLKKRNEIREEKIHI